MIFHNLQHFLWIIYIWKVEVRCSWHRTTAVYVQWIFSKMALCWRRGDKLLNKDYFFFFIQKVFSSVHNIQIEPLMADGLFWRCLSYFSGSWQRYLVGSKWAVIRLPVFIQNILNRVLKMNKAFTASVARLGGLPPQLGFYWSAWTGE